MELYGRALRRWPWIFLLAVLGGALGVGIGWLTPPTYRATAIANIGIDYGRSQWLDEDAERHVMNRVQDVLLADDTLQSALEGLRTRGTDLPASLADLRSRIRLVRVEARWQLSVSSESPETAAAVANAWADSGLHAVDEAVIHAWRAAELQALYFRVSCRPGTFEASGDQAVWVCDEADPPQPDDSSLGDLLKEVELSRGLVPVISASISQRALPPAEPETGERGLLALAGALLGLILGTVLAVALPGRLGPSLSQTNGQATAEGGRSSRFQDPDR